ncbi:MAG: PEP_CTERM-anchored TLD domain-containing protein [Mycobacterium sp.]
MAAVAGTSSVASAGTVVGGSALLGASDVAQLEAWLGAGPLTLTKVFDRVPGDGKRGTDFHAAVDGMGPTFTVLEVTGPETTIIGGYNPNSWQGGSGYVYTPLDADRTAFLFNLVDVVIQRQRLGVAEGEYQTASFSYGFMFGGGHDIDVEETLDGGYLNYFSYGDGPTNILGDTSFTNPAEFGRIEVFALNTPCGSVPAFGCLTSLKSKFSMKSPSDDSKDKLIWKWVKGGALDQSQLADPTEPVLSASYSLCVYAGSANALIAYAGMPPGEGWSAIADKGYKFKGAGPNDVTNALLKAGTSAKSKALVKGAGAGLPDPALPLTYPVTVQLKKNGSPLCLESTFTFADEKKNDATQFKAKQ